MSRPALYILLNVLVAAAAMVGYGAHPGTAHPIYVILLFAMCSTPIIEARAVNGPYSLLVLWSIDFFVMYGALDLRNLVFGTEGAPADAEGILDAAEMVILLGGLLVQVTYRIACRAASGSAPSAAPKDWSELSLVVVGITLWVVATRLCWEFSVNLFTERSNAATLAGLQSLGGIKVGMFMLARMAQPLSILILAYAQCRYRRPYMAPLMVAVVVFQLIYGFIIDFKTEALIGGVLVVLTNLLVYGRVPKIWVALMLVVLAVGFPILQANRVVRDERAENSTKASQNVVEAIQRALQAKERTNTGRDRAQTALERLTTKTSVEIIVRGTGTVTPFQHGYTLTPIFTTFIPRLLWSDKPSIPTGQIMNKEFHISEATETYISPSHLGELYWNFGWAGVIAGMSLIGLTFGTIGGRFNLAQAATITRVLVIVVTVREVILASEGEFATHYVVWMRSLLGVGLLHLLFARVPCEAGSDDVSEPAAIQSFPNLLR